MRHPFKKRERQGGQAVIMVTLTMIPMIAFAGLTTDIGYMYYLKHSAQAAADAAALAAVYRFNKTITGSSFACTQFGWICNNPTLYTCPPNPTTATNPRDSACVYAKLNGFDTANPRQSVTIQSDITGSVPTATGVNGVGYWVTVRVVQRVPQLFSAVLGNRNGVIAARSTAALHPGIGCVYALDPIAPGSFYQNGNTTFNSACGIFVDSADPAAAMLGNGGSTLIASQINVVGGVDWQGTISPVPTTGVSPFPDPLSYLQPPSPPCDSVTGCPSADCSAHPNTTQVNSNVTLLPGTYCGGIRVKNGTATFASGQYIIVGGGVTTQDTNSHIRGSNLFFYNTYNGSNPYKPFDFNANSDVQIAASTSGTYAGILVMQDRGCCASTMPSESFQGGATSFFEGILYFPRSYVSFAGNPSLDMAHYTIVVARRFAVQGTSSMNNDYSHLTGGNPIKTVGLVE